MSYNEPRPISHIGPPVDKRIEPSAPPNITSNNSTIRLLSEHGAVNFSVLASSVKPESLSPDDLQQLRNAASHKVVVTFFSGHFGDLRGAQQLMDRIGVSIAFPDQFYDDLHQLLPRLNEGVLASLGTSQPPVLGEYNIAGARAILKANGFTDSELENAQVMKVLNYRHVLTLLKKHRQTDIEHL